MQGMKGELKTPLVLGGLVIISAYLLIGRYAGPYEAKCVFAECSLAKADNEKADVLDYYSGYSYPEVFEMRKVDWRSGGVILRALQQFRANHPDSQVEDKNLIGTLANAKMDLQPHSYRVTITVRSESSELAASLANAYAKAIELYTDEKNAIRCEKALLQIHQQVVKQKRVYDDLAARSQKTALSDANLMQLEHEKKVALDIYQDLLQKEKAHRIAVEQGNLVIRIRRPAQIPTKPVGWWPW